VLCEQLDESVSGYHQHALRLSTNDGRKPGSIRISDDALLAHIKAIPFQVKGEDGWPRMWKEILARGIRVGKERVRTLMKRHGIKARTKRKFKATTNSAHNMPVAPNLIQRDFAPVDPIRSGRRTLRIWRLTKVGCT
jgi:transposase InsO family protein